MINLLNIQTPAAPEAREVKSEFGLLNLGFRNFGTVYWNLSAPALYEEAIFRREARISPRKSRMPTRWSVSR